MPFPHTRAAIVSTGDEIVIGQTLDTNSRWIADRLTDLGILPFEHATVPDDATVLGGTIRRLGAVAPLVIVTGGLGPTDGDLTRPALAGVLACGLVEDPDALAMLDERLRRRGRTMTDRQRRQAQRPELAVCLPNEHGTAPGLWASMPAVGGAGAFDIACLPGPPVELRPMFETHVVPRLRPDPARRIGTRRLHIAGVPEAEAVQRLGTLTERGRNPLVGITASGAVLTVRIRAEAPDAGGVERLLAEAESHVRSALDPHVFGRDDETLAGAVLGALRTRGARLATVESCTGGMLGAMLTEVSGSSDVYLAGWITYSNDAKSREVGVSPGVLAAHGAVSAEVASAMAEGGLRRADASCAAAITGVAGPSGGTGAKPVGTVVIAVATRAPLAQAVEVRRFLFPGDREEVRVRSARTALTMLYFATTGARVDRLLWQTEPTTRTGASA